MLVVRPKLQNVWGLAYTKHCFHSLLVTYIFANVFGNMLLSIVVDSSLKDCREYKGRGRYCDTCKQNQPEDSWHCATCNACILQRDHHCFFLSQCIGRYNLRYFVCFLAHAVMSFVLSIYYNYSAMEHLDITGFMDITFIVVQFFKPGNISIPPFDVKKYLYELFLYLNVIAFILCGSLLWLHLGNALRGMTSYERKIGKFPAKTDLRRNMERAFGTRWYLAILWPLVDSPLVDKRSKIV
ncbi:probable palmitoyltransferase ZDHHC24 [Cydia strobilella]|uniref:probable palmitoyltransferase ZDHHC24 n=1 Tax=Cydia strobilella TaxID=1100964 RepID=UPI00300666A2